MVGTDGVYWKSKFDTQDCCESVVGISENAEHVCFLKSVLHLKTCHHIETAYLFSYREAFRTVGETSWIFNLSESEREQTKPRSG